MVSRDCQTTRRAGQVANLDGCLLVTAGHVEEPLHPRSLCVPSWPPAVMFSRLVPRSWNSSCFAFVRMGANVVDDQQASGAPSNDVYHRGPDRLPS